MRGARDAATGGEGQTARRGQANPTGPAQTAPRLALRCPLLAGIRPWTRNQIDRGSRKEQVRATARDHLGNAGPWLAVLIAFWRSWKSPRPYGTRWPLSVSQSLCCSRFRSSDQVGIVAAAWFGGAGPGFLAALLATLVLPLLITMNYPLTAGFFDLPRFLAFGITGLAVGWGTTFRRRAEATLRRSELELRKARNELEMKVLEQTAELRRSEALLTEAQKLSRTGSFSWKVSMGEMLWSEETFRIFRTGSP